MTRITRKVGPAFLAPLGLLIGMAVLLGPSAGRASAARAPDADDLLVAAMNRCFDLVEAPAAQPPRTFTASWRVIKAEGVPPQVAGATGEIAYQAPDLLKASATVGGETYVVGRIGQRLWAHQPGKKFGLVATPGVLRFKSDPTSIDETTLPPFRMPVSRLKTRVAVALLVRAGLAPAEKVGADDCHVLDLTLLPKAAEMAGIEGGRARVWLRQSDGLPRRVSFTDGRRMNVEIEIDPALSAPWPAEKWKLIPNEGDHIETVALSHITKFIEIAPKLLENDVPALGPATGKRELVATAGRGRLELIDGTRVLYLKGTPEEMGRQHGTLLKTEIRDMTNRILYGVGVGSSFAKGAWFFGEIEGAQARLQPHIDSRYVREMDAIAAAAGLHPQEGRLSNFFPELFHCSGFAIMGKASKDGHIYHGRVLDYMRGVGLEQNAVVIVHQPDVGNAWVNVSYAGFVGTVTAMNEKGISIGEMGGRGAGAWDGKPMAQLLREVMEKANTLDEAVAIMKAGPRTCEYYYVIADGKSKTAVGIGATPDKFEVVKPGEAHPRLPSPVEDTVLLSAGDRYDLLAKRVQAGFGQFDADRARDLMTRPVCMTSNIHSVLFQPDTLDLWVANADSKNVASHTRYTHYNLKELLNGKTAEAGF